MRRTGNTAVVGGAFGQCDCQRPGFGDIDARNPGQPRAEQVGLGHRGRDRVASQAPQHDCGFGRAGAQVRGRREQAQPGLFEVVPRGLVEHLREATLPDAGCRGATADILDEVAQLGELVIGVGGEHATREDAHRCFPLFAQALIGVSALREALIAIPFPAR